jgi:hypothetical protein
MKAQNKITEHDWNFSDVSEDELIVCSYWEYARESASIRNAVEIAKTAHANQGIPRPESAEREAFRPAADKAYSLLHSTGFDPSFWVGLPFPEPWQFVDKTKREKWAHVRPEIPTPLKFPPFQVATDLFITSILHNEATNAHEARNAIYLRLSQIDSGVENLKEAGELREKLSEQEKHPTPLIVRGQGGVDSFIAQINWREFSKKEIKDCLSKWVDDYSCPIAKPSERGRPVNWRARLESLGLLRLRHIQSVEETIQTIAQTLPSNKRKATKFTEPGELNREAQNTVADFRNLFTFLDSAEIPISWPLK